MLLTGAGASVPVGVPAMAGMASAFKESLRSRSSLTDTYDLLLELGAKPDVESLLELSNTLSESLAGGVKQLYEEASSPRGGSRHLRQFRRRVADHRAEISTFRTALLKSITHMCLGFDREHARDLYGPLVADLARYGVPVFTTNYDAVLEEAAQSRQIPIKDNFVRSSRGRWFWDPSLNAFYGDGLRLVQIHGSIQWYRDPSGRVEKIRQPATVSIEGEPLDQLVIFPTRFKDIYSTNYFPLYSSYTRTLGQARVLIVIGHSLRDEYLTAAIRDRLRDESFSLVLIDP